ncbi:probable G-protein coupled receptor 33 [Terrapene carolina triunguis]|uniref:probable G-protein coupled receptor 33 n=1 Tax=Terrapene triunguis TaxID=2587831 RepID=UPI000E77D477|nr:probable G-protein coupled receptor 33 [Terrapene carolina triunguis]
MDRGNMTIQPTTGANSSQTPAAVSAAHLAVAALLFTTFLVGVVGNGLYLWVLGLKMRRTVTTLVFLHLVSSYLLLTLLIPFFAVYLLLDFHWVFGTAMCKLLNACISVGMFTSVFLLTLISLDRYILTHRPVWCRHRRTVPRVRKLVVGVWLVSLALSTPYLAFRETRVVDGERIICINNYTLSRVWNGAETQDLGRRIHLAVLTFRFLLGFLLPFCTIAGCYGCVGLEMKEKGLARSRKPFKVMVAAVVSFFLSWLPYHLYHGLKFFRDGRELDIILVIYTLTSCFNACFTPVLYLFVGRRFQQVLKMSLLALLRETFAEDLSGNGAISHESSGVAAGKLELPDQVTGPLDSGSGSLEPRVLG